MRPRTYPPYSFPVETSGPLDSDLIPFPVKVKPPRLPGRVVLRDSLDLSIDALLADIYIHATNCVRAFGDFHLAISASPETEPLLMRLMYEPGYRDFPWKRTRLWMVDELDVPLDDPRRRSTRLEETLVACSGIPQNQFHVLDPASGWTTYEKTLKEHLGWREKGQDRIDCILLALDENGRLMPYGHVSPAHPPADILAPVPVSKGPSIVAIPQPFLLSSRLVAVHAGAATYQGIQYAAAWAKSNPHHFSLVGGELMWFVHSSQLA